MGLYNGGPNSGYRLNTGLISSVNIGACTFVSDMPMKSLPVLQVQNGKLITYCQSGAIVRHLARKFGKPLICVSFFTENE